jgi:hypothetical protein
VLAPLTVAIFLILTSSDVTALIFMALHFPPNLAVVAVLVLVSFLLARRAWRRWGHRIVYVRGLTGVATLALGALWHFRRR